MIPLRVACISSYRDRCSNRERFRAQLFGETLVHAAFSEAEARSEAAALLRGIVDRLENPPSVSIALDAPVGKLGIGRRWAGILERGGIATVEQLVQRDEVYLVVRLPGKVGLGRSGLRAIKEALARHGLRLSPAGGL